MLSWHISAVRSTFESIRSKLDQDGLYSQLEQSLNQLFNQYQQAFVSSVDTLLKDEPTQTKPHLFLCEFRLVETMRQVDA